VSKEARQVAESVMRKWRERCGFDPDAAEPEHFRLPSKAVMQIREADRENEERRLRQ